MLKFRRKLRRKAARVFSRLLFMGAVLLLIWAFTWIERQAGPVQASYTPVPYDRKAYVHWIDEDGDGLSTRQEVLKAESLVPAALSKDGRKVTAGLWEDPYTGKRFTDPKQLDIDHLVPLKNAHISGGWAWDSARKKAFANDLSFSEHLIAVDKTVNRQKGDKPPHLWMPPNEAYRCPYLSNWIQIKKRWNLAIEAETYRLLEACP